MGNSSNSDSDDDSPDVMCAKAGLAKVFDGLIRISCQPLLLTQTFKLPKAGAHSSSDAMANCL